MVRIGAWQGQVCVLILRLFLTIVSLSIFHFTIRVRASFADPPEHLRGSVPALAGKQVLIVDDNAASGQALSDIFRQWGAQVRWTDSPKAALALVTAAPPAAVGGDGKTASSSPHNILSKLSPAVRRSMADLPSMQQDVFAPDLALIDLEMPSASSSGSASVTGLSLANSIRALRSKKQLPILLMCALRQRHKDMRAVVNGFITKPFKPAAVFRAAINALTVGGDSAAGAADPPSSSTIIPALSRMLSDESVSGADRSSSPGTPLLSSTSLPGSPSPAPLDTSSASGSVSLPGSPNLLTVNTSDDRDRLPRLSQTVSTPRRRLAQSQSNPAAGTVLIPQSSTPPPPPRAAPPTPLGRKAAPSPLHRQSSSRAVVSSVPAPAGAAVAASGAGAGAGPAAGAVAGDSSEPSPFVSTGVVRRTSAFRADLAAHYPLRVLVAEDNGSHAWLWLALIWGHVFAAINQKVILAMLKKLGYKADCVDNGQKAVEAVKKAALAVMAKSSDAKSEEPVHEQGAVYDIILMVSCQVSPTEFELIVDTRAGCANADHGRNARESGNS